MFSSYHCKGKKRTLFFAINLLFHEASIKLIVVCTVFINLWAAPGPAKKKAKKDNTHKRISRVLIATYDSCVFVGALITALIKFRRVKEIVWVEWLN